MLRHPVVVLTALALTGCGDDTAPMDAGTAPPPPEAAGVQVAMWTPTDVRMMASGRGALTVADGCLALASDAGGVAFPVFPYGSTAWDSATQTLTFGDEAYALGDTLRYGGGSVERGSDRLGDGERFLPPCATGWLFLVSPPRPGGTAQGG